MIGLPQFNAVFEPCRRMRLRHSAHLQRGFTLVELLVVFAIAALLVGLAPVAFGKLKESSQYRDTLRGVLSELRQARQTAQASGAHVRFHLDLTKREYGRQGLATHAIPEGLQVRATVGSTELSADQVASILFLPDGGATGGTFEFVRPSGTGTRIQVDWLTGRIEQTALQP